MEKSNDQQIVTTLEDNSKEEEIQKSNPFKNKLLKQIQEQGYENQNQILMQMGYQCLNKNYKLLIEQNGNVDAVAQILNQKKENKKQKQTQLNNDEDSTTLVHKLQQILGDFPQEKIQKAIKKCNNNEEEALQLLQQKQKNMQKRKAKKQEMNQQQKYKKNIKQIEKQDKYQKQFLTNTVKKILKNISKIQQNQISLYDSKQIDEKQLQKIFKQYQNEIIELSKEFNSLKLNQIIKQFKKNSFDLQKTKEKLQIKVKENKYIEEISLSLSFLTVNGFFNLQQNIEALIMTDLNQQKALSLLQQKRQTSISNETLIDFMKNDIFSESLIKQSLQQSEGNVQQALSICLQQKTKTPYENQKCVFINNGKIPENTDKLIIDGNNLFFIDERIRKIYLKQKNTHIPELIFTSLIRQMQKLKYLKTVITIQMTIFFAHFRHIMLQIKQCILVFDKTSNIVNENSFQVMTAFPKFKTGDDLVVDLSAKEAKENQQNIVYVTSDLGLTERIQLKGGVKFIKSGKFLQILIDFIGDQQVSSIIEGINNQNK